MDKVIDNLWAERDSHARICAKYVAQGILPELALSHANSMKRYDHAANQMLEIWTALVILKRGL